MIIIFSFHERTCSSFRSSIHSTKHEENRIFHITFFSFACLSKILHLNATLFREGNSTRVSAGECVTSFFGLDGELQLGAANTEVEIFWIFKELVNNMITRGRHRTTGERSNNRKLGTSVDRIMTGPVSKERSKS